MNPFWDSFAQVARVSVGNQLAGACWQAGHIPETKWLRFPRAIAVDQTQPTPMDIGAVGKGKSGKGGKGAKGAGKRNNQIQQACSRCGNTDQTSANCPHSDKTCRKCGKVGHLASVCGVKKSIFWNSSAQGKGWSEGQGRWQRFECCQNMLELWWEWTHVVAMHQEEVPCGGRIHHCESGWQSGHNHGWIGRKPLRCWQREWSDHRAEGRKWENLLHGCSECAWRRICWHWDRFRCWRVAFLWTSAQTRIHFTRRGSACVEVTT